MDLLGSSLCGRAPRGGPALSIPLLPRSPPRPSPGSLHYSDEDVTKYNDLIPAESSSLTEKPSEVSDSQVPTQDMGMWDTGTPGKDGQCWEPSLSANPALCPPPRASCCALGKGNAGPVLLLF